MRRCTLALCVAATVLLPSVALAATLQIRPTTKLSALTSNNTSAANSFVTQPSGNLGASNISKLDIHSLLYPAAQTRIFAHLVLWFGQRGHMNVGYRSTDPAQVKRQISDMISRGIDGVVMVWYGPDNAIDRAARLVMREAENHPGFTFAIMVDNGAIRWNSCPGCDPQSALVHQLRYIEQTYFSSPAYLRVNGRPVVTNFDIDLFYKVDWGAARAALATNPMFLYQNSGGFSHGHSDGAYSWSIATTTDFGISYLTKFYRTGMAFPGKQTWGASYKGFSDQLATWGRKRFMGQQCGQTWLRTFSRINTLYNSTNQLPAIQLVTWNDYEEGTEIESGIDNCVSIAAELTGNLLQWSITGRENTIDHYSVYIGRDRKNLMQLTAQSTSSHSLDLCDYSLPSGDFTLYVQAVGKPTLKNQLSAPLRYTSQCASGSGDAKAQIVVGVSPASVTIRSGESATSTIAVSPKAGSFDRPVSLSCSNLPEGMACSFAPGTVIPGSRAGKSTLTVSTPVVPGAVGRLGSQNKVPIHAGWSALGVAGLALFGGFRRKRIARAGLAGAVILMALLSNSCGGRASGPDAAISPGTYDIKISGVSGNAQASAWATITIQ